MSSSTTFEAARATVSAVRGTAGGEDQRLADAQRIGGGHSASPTARLDPGEMCRASASGLWSSTGVPARPPGKVAAVLRCRQARDSPA